MLSMKGVHAYYGTSHVLKGIDLEVHDGEAVALLGRNGAGKSTTLKSVIGLGPKVSGAVTWEGESCVGRKAFKNARSGIGYVPEDRRIYGELSVEDNLLLGKLASMGKRRPVEVDQAYKWFPVLGERRRQSGGSLSGGEQQMLAIARTLMGRPSLLLLDEPTEGLAPLIVEELLERLQQLIRAQGQSVLLCEQNLQFSLEMVDRVYVVDAGQIVYEGAADDFRRRTDLQHRYLAVQLGRNA